MSFSDLSNLSEDDFARAAKACRGNYQENILTGHEAISGSTLKGKAASYRSRYQESSANLIGRLRSLGLLVSVERRKNGKRVLVVASPAGVVASPAGVVS